MEGIWETSPCAQEARDTLQAFADIMPARRADSGFAADADKQILQIAGDFRSSWSSRDDALFASLRQKMDKNSAIALDSIVETPWWWRTLDKLLKIVAVQAVFWVLLLYFYQSRPTSRPSSSGTVGRENFSASATSISSSLGFPSCATVCWRPSAKNSPLIHTSPMSLKEYFDDAQRPNL